MLFHNLIYGYHAIHLPSDRETCPDPECALRGGALEINRRQGTDWQWPDDDPQKEKHIGKSVCTYIKYYVWLLLLSWIPSSAAAEWLSSSVVIYLFFMVLFRGTKSFICGCRSRLGGWAIDRGMGWAAGQINWCTRLLIVDIIQYFIVEWVDSVILCFNSLRSFRPRRVLSGR